MYLESMPIPDFNLCYRRNQSQGSELRTSRGMGITDANVYTAVFMAVSMLDGIVVDDMATAQCCKRAAVAAEPGPSEISDLQEDLAYCGGGAYVWQLLSHCSLVCCSLLVVMNEPI